MRTDDAGEFWNIAAGAIIGAAISGGAELLAQVASSTATGKKIDWGSVGLAAAGGAVSGALASTGIGAAGQKIGNAAIGFVSETVAQIRAGSDFKTAAANVVFATGVGFATGKIGGEGARCRKSALGETHDMVMKSTKTLKKYTRKKTYSSAVLQPYNKCLKNLRKALRPRVTKKATKGFVKATFVSQGAYLGKRVVSYGWKRYRK